MSAQQMLDQLLRSGVELFRGGSLPQAGLPGAAGTGSADWSQLGTGALAGGAIGLLLGSKRGRKMGGKALKYGSVAALGYAGYRVYKKWQEEQQRAASPAPAGSAARHPGFEATPRAEDNWQAGAGSALPALPAPALEEHSRAMLQAMIAAAKADGHLDERERGLISAELARLEAEPAQREWLAREVERPLDPAEVAKAAATPALASEMYLASLLVVDETSFMERAYLDELARQMDLPAELKSRLEAQAAAGAG